MKQIPGRERIDRGAIDYFSQVDVFVWSVAHGPNEYIDLRKIIDCAAIDALTAWDLQRSGMKQIPGRERIDRGAIDYFSQVDVFVWSVRHGEQAGTVGIGRDALSGVEADLQPAGTHLKTWRFARNRSYAARQRYPERLLLAACGRLPLLQYLPFEWHALAPAT